MSKEHNQRTLFFVATILLVAFSIPIVLAVLGICESLYLEIYTTYFLLTAYISILYLLASIILTCISVIAVKDEDQLHSVCLTTTVMIIGALCWTYFRAHRGEELRVRILLIRLIIVPVTVVCGFAMLTDQSKEIIAAYIAFVISAYLSIDSVITAIIDDKEKFVADKK